MSAIETERLRLERWDERHLEDFVRLASDPRVTRYIRGGGRWSREQSERTFARQLDHWREHGFGWRAAIEKATGSWLGFSALNYVGAGVPEIAPDEVEIGWWLTPSSWGQGLATEGAVALRDEGFERVGLERIIARFEPANAASGRVMEKIGMHFEREARGVAGELVRVYALDRARWLAL